MESLPPVVAFTPLVLFYFADEEFIGFRMTTRLVIEQGLALAGSLFRTLGLIVVAATSLSCPTLDNRHSPF